MMGNLLGRRRREEEKGKGKRKETSIFREMKDFPSPFQQPLHLNNTHRLIPLFHPFNFEERNNNDEKKKPIWLTLIFLLLITFEQ